MVFFVVFFGGTTNPPFLPSNALDVTVHHWWIASVQVIQTLRSCVAGLVHQWSVKKLLKTSPSWWFQAR